MISLSFLLTLTHLIGLALGVGAATVKLTLLLKCGTNQAFVPVYLKVARPVTRLIILGMILLTLSGIAWLVLAYRLTPLLLAKIILVGAIWALGPLIDNVVEPRFQKLAPADGAPASPDFTRVHKQYLTLEVVATGLFYVIVVMGVLI